MNVSDMKIGQEAVITEVLGTGALRHRLLEMGLIPGTKIKLVKKAPFGDPIELNVRCFDLSIRKDDAKLINVRE